MTYVHGIPVLARSAWPRRLIALAAIVALCTTGFVYGVLPRVASAASMGRQVVYRTARAAGRAEVLLRVRSWDSQLSGLVRVMHTPQDASIAPAVAAYADQAYESVSGDLGYTSPRELTVILFPSFEDLESFLPGTGPGRTVGVCWDGVVGMVSPASWGRTFGEKTGMDAFYSYNPLYHEITHFVLEETVPGGWPAWFSEGVAQLEEYQATGYAWKEADPALSRETASRVLALEVIDGAFLEPELVNAAYRKSMWVAERLAQVCGPGTIPRLAGLLKKGLGFEEALQLVSGLTYAGIDREWLADGWSGPASWQDQG